MKHLIRFTLITSLCLMSLTADQPAKSPFVGQKAPNFKAEAVQIDETKTISLEDFPGKYKILIFYPADFSFVCPTELFAFQKEQPEFEKRNAVLIGISVDQKYTHSAWLSQTKENGGIKGITYPLIADVIKKISRDYGVLDEQQGIALRGLIIIDKNNIIQHQSINNLSVGRGIDEVLRTLDAIIFSQEHGDVCPANWHEGEEAINPTKTGLQEYQKKQSNKEKK